MPRPADAAVSLLGERGGRGVAGGESAAGLDLGRAVGGVGRPRRSWRRSGGQRRRRRRRRRCPRRAGCPGRARRRCRTRCRSASLTPLLAKAVPSFSTPPSWVLMTAPMPFTADSAVGRLVEDGPGHVALRLSAAGLDVGGAVGRVGRRAGVGRRERAVTSSSTSSSLSDSDVGVLVEVGARCSELLPSASLTPLLATASPSLLTLTLLGVEHQAEARRRCRGRSGRGSCSRRCRSRRPCRS